jgi:hypothetical protein
MSHPYYHAISSVRKFGGKAEDYQDIHHWFDATKATVADTRHRAFRHHIQAIGLLCREQGRTSLLNADGVLVTLDEIGRQHIAEDFGGYTPHRVEWADAIREQGWMQLAVGQPGQKALAACMRRFGGVAEDYAGIMAWFLEGVTEEPRSYFERGHAAACFWAERLFGVALPTSTGRLIPTRLVAETIVSRMFANGIIPSTVDWVRSITRPAWCRTPEKLAA